MRSAVRELRRTSVVAAAVALLLAAPAGTAAAAPPVNGYRATPLLSTNNPWGDWFEPSTSGNPINSTGLVAGYAPYGNLSNQAAVLDTRTGLLHTFGDDPRTYATDVNDRGDVVGYRDSVGQPAFYRPRGGDSVETDEMDGDVWVSTEPAAVNDHGIVVGTQYRSDDTPPQAFIWDPEHTTEPQLLGSLGGGSSAAFGINNAGYVVGSSTTRSGATHPFVWLPKQQLMTDIGTLTGYTGGVARDINAGSYVVGEATLAGHRNQAFVWSPITHKIRGLATPAGQGSTAYAINYHGVITGGLIPRGSLIPTIGAVWGACNAPVQTLTADGDVVIGVGITRQERILGFASRQPVWWEKDGPCVQT